MSQLQSNRPTRMGQTPWPCPPGQVPAGNGQCVLYSPPSSQVAPGSGGASPMVAPGAATAGSPTGYPQRNYPSGAWWKGGAYGGMRVLSPPSGMFGRQRR